MPWIGGAISAGGSLLGGMFGSDSAGKAAKEQRKAAQIAVAEQKRQFDINQENQAPWMQAGTNSINRLSFLLGLSNPKGQTIKDITTQLLQSGNFGAPSTTETGRLYRKESRIRDEGPDHITPAQYVFSDGTISANPTRQVDGRVNWDALNAEANKRFQAQTVGDDFGSLTRNFTMADFEADPVAQLGFQTGLDQGTSAINKRAAAMGGFDSGATLKALTRFGNDFGNQKANESFNRFNLNQSNLFNRLSGIAGSGQQSVNQVGAAGQNFANNMGNIQMGLGNARGAAAIAQGNAWSGAIGGVANSLGNWWEQQNAKTPANGFHPGVYNGPTVFGTSSGE